MKKIVSLIVMIGMILSASAAVFAESSLIQTDEKLNASFATEMPAGFQLKDLKNNSEETPVFSGGALNIGGNPRYALLSENSCYDMSAYSSYEIVYECELPATTNYAYFIFGDYNAETSISNSNDPLAGVAVSKSYAVGISPGNSSNNAKYKFYKKSNQAAETELSKSLAGTSFKYTLKVDLTKTENNVFFYAGNELIFTDSDASPITLAKAAIKTNYAKANVKNITLIGHKDYGIAYKIDGVSAVQMGTGTISAKLPKAVVSGKAVVFAMYNADGNLLNAKIVQEDELENDEITLFPSDSAQNTLRAFIWDSLDSMNPQVDDAGNGLAAVKENHQ